MSLETTLGAIRVAWFGMRVGRGMVASLRSGVRVRARVAKGRIAVKISYPGPGTGMEVKSFLVAPARRLRTHEGRKVAPISGDQLPVRLEQNSGRMWTFNAYQVAYEYFNEVRELSEDTLPREKRKAVLEVELGNGLFVPVVVFDAPPLYSKWPQYQKNNRNRMLDAFGRPPRRMTGKEASR